jgi:uncharacterized membrane protein YoaK (UPF0700 family)
MNASVASSTAVAVRTTHMTGPATDFGVSLAVAWFSEGAKRQEALQLAALRGGKLVAFIVGAALMFPLITRVGHAAFLAPALAIAAATVRSFMQTTERSPLAVRFTRDGGGGPEGQRAC